MNIFRSYKTCAEIFSSYLNEKNIVLQPRTYIGHKGKISLFLKWLKNNNLDNKQVYKITDNVIYNFFIYLANERDLDKATCEKYRDTLRMFFKYAQQSGEITELPFDRIIIPKKKRDCKPKYIPLDKQKELLEDILEHDYQLFLGCMIQYCSAIRPGREMLNLKVSDFNFKDKTISVGELNSKTGKKRYADLTDELIEYCICYGIDKTEPNYYIFGKRKTFGTKHICSNNLTTRFNKFRNNHNIDKGVKFYSFKHTGLTDLITSKIASLPQLQKHAGHDRITSTEKYIITHVGVTNDNIKNNFTSLLCNGEEIKRSI